MANRDLNELFKTAFKGAGEVHVMNLRSLLSHMIGQMEETNSKQVSQHESLVKQINQNRKAFQKYVDPDELRSLRDTPLKYPDPDPYAEEVRALREEFQKYPDPEMLNQCVTWDAMQSALHGETQSLRNGFLNSGPVHPAVAQTEPPEVPSEQLGEVKSSLESLVNETSQQRALIESLVNETSQQRALTESLVNETSQHRALIDNLTERLDSLEGMFLNQRPETETTSATSESLDLYRKTSHELRQQIFSLRTSVKKQEEDMKKLSAKVTLCEERNTHQDLPDKLDKTGMVEKTMMSVIPKCLRDEAEQDESKDRPASTTSLVEIESNITFVFQRCEQLQEAVKRVVCKEMLRDTENVEAMANLQNAILQLQSKGQSHFDKLKEDTRNLGGKVSRLQSDFVSKLSKLTVEMETRVTRADMKSILKKQLKEHKMLQEADDIAGLRKPLGERFQCLSCAKPVIKQIPRQPPYPKFGQSSSFSVPAPEQYNRNQDPDPDPVGKIQLPQLEVKPLTPLPPVCKSLHPNRTNASASKKKAGVTGRVGHPGTPALH